MYYVYIYVIMYVFMCIYMYVYMCVDVDVCVHMSIFTNSSARAGCDMWFIFKRSLTGSNSEFSFLTCYLSKANQPSLPYNLIIILNGKDALTQ